MASEARARVQALETRVQHLESANQKLIQVLSGLASTHPDEKVRTILLQSLVAPPLPLSSGKEAMSEVSSPANKRKATEVPKPAPLRAKRAATAAAESKKKGEENTPAAPSALEPTPTHISKDKDAAKTLSEMVRPPTTVRTTRAAAARAAAVASRKKTAAEEQIAPASTPEPTKAEPSVLAKPTPGKGGGGLLARRLGLSPFTKKNAGAMVASPSEDKKKSGVAESTHTPLSPAMPTLARRPPAEPTLRGQVAPERPLVVVGTMEQIQRAQRALYSTKGLSVLDTFRFLPFKVLQAEAEAAVAKWAHSVWFAPAAFAERMLPTLKLSPVLVPYYHATSSAKVTYLAKVKTSARGGGGGHLLLRNAMTTTQDVHGELQMEFCDIKVLAERSWGNKGAGMMGNDGSSLSALLDGVSNWETEHALEGKATALEAPPRASLRPPSSEDADLGPIEVLPPKDVPSAWPNVEQCILQSVRLRCGEDVRRKQEGAEIQRLNLTQVDFGQTTMQLMFVPAYVGSYKYGSSRYAVVVNGSTRLCRAAPPPYGLGKVLGSGLALMEDLLGTRDVEFPVLVTGEYLNETDGTARFPAKATFLVWPFSHNYLLGYATGLIHLRNRGKRPIHLASWSRTNPSRGSPYVGKAEIPSNSSVELDYCGGWALQILDGEPADLEVVDWKTSGGSAQPQSSTANPTISRDLAMAV